MNLITTIEHDLTAAGHHVDDTAHRVLARHLALDNIALHVATELQVLARSPLTAVAAGAVGLSPVQEQVIAELAAQVGQWLGHAAQPAPAAASDPAPETAQ